MAYTARGLVDYGRSLANLQSTKFVSYSDEGLLLNESYREIYSRYTESGGDYYVTEYVFTLTSAMLAANQIGGVEYLVPLPDDFEKIRYLDWNTGGQWFPVDRFNTAQKDFTYGAPRYAIKNSSLWLIVSPGTGSQFRLGYYPVPVLATLPDVPISYGSSIAAYNLPLALWPVYVPQGRTLIYVYNGATIIAESADARTSTTLYAVAGTKTNLVYYKGYIYWLEAGNIRRATTDLTSTLVPATIVSGLTVQNFSIIDDLLYFSVAGSSSTCNLDGTNVVAFQAFFTKDVRKVGLLFAWFDSTFHLFINGVQVVTYTASSNLESDGTYLYVQDGGLKTVSRLTVSSAGAITATTLLLSDVAFINSLAGGFIGAIVNSTSALLAFSAVADTTFSFPTNEVNELMAYMCAVAFCRKEKDGERMALLQPKLDQLWERFWAVNKRDEYQFARVNDGYYGGNLGGLGSGM